MKKIVSIVFFILTGILLFLVALIGFAARWTLTTWGDLDIDEIIFQLQTPLEGTGNGMIADYIIKGFIPAVVLLAIYILVMVLVKNKRFRFGAAILCLVITIAAGAGIKRYIWNGLNVDEWLAGQSAKSMLIEENYVDPADVKLEFPSQKRNLLFIYLESMETTYADRESGGAFEVSCIPELTELAKENEDFSGNTSELNGGIVFPGTNNTSKAIFAHSTGLPLKVDIGSNNMDTQDSFFSNIIGLGDILQEEGYNQLFLLGSNATFGGRRLFFKDHGDFQIRDYKYAKENGWIPEDYKVFWGYEDKKMFEFAKETIVELAQQKQPFNLTMLTVDTHFEDGYVCDLCTDEFGDNQYANVMACSSRQVTEFVRWVMEQDFYENTTIVLTGDHTTMDTDFLKDIDAGFPRRTYTAYINSAVEPVQPDERRIYSTFDTFPTTLAALGVQIEGNRLGLGVNLFSDCKTLPEEFETSYVSEELKKRSDFLMQLEKIDLDSEDFRNRLSKSLEGSVSVQNYDPTKGIVEIRVKPVKNVQFGVDYMEVEYEETSTGNKGFVKMSTDPEDAKAYIGALDISSWKGTDGEIRIHYHVRNGAVYRNLTTVNLSDILKEEQK